MDALSSLKGAFLAAESEVPLTVFDLPQLRQKPTASTLINALDDLRSVPPSWQNSPALSGANTPRTPSSGTSTPLYPKRRRVDPKGVTHYLTSIVSSPLRWLSEEEREEVWTQASTRLSERSGRTGMGSLSRTFSILLDEREAIDINIYEPALTGDSLGHKTWASSYLLASRLWQVKTKLPNLSNISGSAVLELGSGTGLVGIAAAAVLKTSIMLTDLPEIQMNLARNVAANMSVIEDNGGAANTTTLDWQISEDAELGAERFKLILAADCVYSTAHPPLLAQTVRRWLSITAEARFWVELPIREGFGKELDLFLEEMKRVGLRIVEEGKEMGVDDWGDADAENVREVECWWAIWRWGDEILGSNGKHDS
ncbi:MAG: hypothetical protein M1820_004924 [Bogoriella megaspora]|nr:MAG: hypothetical protein M1820_004924 [Bogoriella megaspora]